MTSFLHSVQSVALILFLTATGYFCSYKDWFKDESKAFISKFLLTFAIPFTCIYSFRTRIDSEMLRGAGPLLLVPFLNLAGLFILAFFFANALKLPRKTYGVFIVECAMSNTLFIGFPVCLELFGDDSIAYVILFYIVSTCYSQLIANSIIIWSGEAGSKSSKSDLIRKIVTAPPIIGIFVGIIVVLANIPLPSVVLSYSSYMSNLVSPLALLIAGKIIYDIGLKNVKIDKLVTIVMLFRFIISPGICYLLCVAFGVDGLARNVFIIQAAMPIMTQTVVSATEYKADEEFAAQGCAITTIVMFGVIPVLMLLLGS